MLFKVPTEFHGDAKTDERFHSSFEPQTCFSLDDPKKVLDDDLEDDLDYQLVNSEDFFALVDVLVHYLGSSVLEIVPALDSLDSRLPLQKVGLLSEVLDLGSRGVLHEVPVKQLYVLDFVHLRGQLLVSSNVVDERLFLRFVLLKCLLELSAEIILSKV